MEILKNKWTQVMLVVFSLMILTNCESQTKRNEVKLQKTDVMKNTNEIIVDVRTTEEWNMDGHAECSVNYPLDQIQNKIEDLKKYNHIVLVCRSGNRAGIAKQILEGAGLKNIENKGPWQNAVCKN
ncbi:MAG: rhodanese-like domain-containing protein [Bacteroidia bacterium]|nr:rhodanese-like domain-containing protein [Bacteroidia bacterium]